MSEKRYLFVKDPTFVTDTGVASLLDTANDYCVFDVSDLENISIFVDQIIDAGTCTITVEKTIDGTNWANVATPDQTAFPTGANKSKEYALSDSNGMPLRAKQVKVTLTAVAGGGTYSAHVGGRQVEGMR